MSYKIIARKWRPKSFLKLIGQDVIKKTLLQALKLNRLSHALLFTGIRGTGKTSTARIVAKHLRCLRGREPPLKNMHLDPCELCKECLEIHTGRNPNVLEIDGASHNGVDAIRELSSHVLYVPSSGLYKVYIIDEVHMLSMSAFNALLKTLEEPPSHVFFILATTEAHKIPVTVLSRCQRFDFRRIPAPTIVKQLELICESEKIKVEPQALWLIARQSEGSLRDAERLLDQVISFSSSDSPFKDEKENTDFVLRAKDVTEVFGLIDRTLLFEILHSILNQDIKGALQVLDKLYEAGYDPIEFIKGLLEELRNMLLIKLAPKNRLSLRDNSKTGLLEVSSKSSLHSTSKEAPHSKETLHRSTINSEIYRLIDLPEEEILKLKSLGSLLTESDIHFLFDMALKGSHDVLQSRDSRIVMEMLLLRMTEAPRVENLHAWMEGGDLPSKAREIELSL